MVIKEAIVVKIGGIDTRIAAVKVWDNRQDRITLIPYPQVNLEIDGRSIPIESKKITSFIHEDGQDVHTHFTYKLNDEKINTVDYVLLADNKENDFASVIYTININRRIDRQPYVNKSRYSLSYITPYNEAENTLIVCYCIATSGKPFPDLRNYGIYRKVFVFDKMQVGVFFTYLNATSYERGRILGNSTSMLRVNDAPPSRIIEPKPHPMLALAESIMSCMSLLIKSYIDNIRQDFTSSGLASPIEDHNFINTIMPLSELRRAGKKSTYTFFGKIIL